MKHLGFLMKQVINVMNLIIINRGLLIRVKQKNAMLEYLKSFVDELIDTFFSSDNFKKKKKKKNANGEGLVRDILKNKFENKYLGRVIAVLEKNKN